MGDRVSVRCCEVEKSSLAVLSSHPVPRTQNVIRPTGFCVYEFAPENRGRLDEFYEVDREKALGEGSFAFVFEASNKATAQVRAIKAINRKSLRSCSKYETEIAIHRQLDHPNIVRCFESFEDGRAIYLVLEVCRGGELFDAILDDGPYSELVAIPVLKTMLRTVCHLHAHHIAHRDLKAENWLLQNAGSLVNAKLKLTDFGLARQLAPDGCARTRAGSPYYVAPEVFEGKYGHRADIWTVGVVFFMMLSGVPPFTGTKTENVLQQVVKARVPMHKMTKALQSQTSGILLQLLEKEQQKRPTAAMALHHKVFADSQTSTNIMGMMGHTNAVDKSKSVQLFNAGHMRSYVALSRIEKMVLSAIATQVDPQDIHGLEGMFNLFDADNDGVLRATEFHEGLQSVGIDIDKKEFAETVFPGMDMDNSCAIDFNEFIAMGLDYQTYTEETLCMMAFKVFDVDNSGFIEVSDLEALLKVSQVDAEDFGQGTAELDALFEKCDSEEDKQIDFEAFHELVLGIRRTQN